MDFLVLGQISVLRGDGTTVGLPSVSQRRLVAFLASQANTNVSVGSLGLHLDLTDGAVRTGIARLRRRLGGYGRTPLVTEGPGYRLATDRIDAARFEIDVHAALNESASDAHLRWGLDQALRLWRGDAYAEFSHEPWAAAEAARLDELRASAAETLIDVLLSLGQHEEALEHAAKVSERHPFRDRPRGQQMRALAAMGRVTESLRSFQDYRAALVDEVGTVPSASLVELEQRIATGQFPVGEVRMLASRPGLDPTVVRDVALLRNAEFGLEEISRQVAADIADHELVTLTGIGGVGKTRLARRLVDGTAGDFDRAVFVDLRPASAAEGVGVAVARALGVESSEPAVIVQVLHQCKTLVVLDNCEHVLAATGELVGEILAGPASIRVLATSRLPLGVAGEHVCPVPVLSPDDAMKLFIDRASKWRDGFAPDDGSTRQWITEICVQLDRIPLAVELAAACVAHMTLREIAAQLNERLTFLPADPIRTRQQQTLRATMDWSYELLDDDGQSLLRALSVFAVGSDAAATATVWNRSVADTFAGLGALVRASLVVAQPDDNTMRYELLETVRLFAAEKASAEGETEPLRRAHAAHYAGVLEAIDTVELLRSVGVRRPDIANHELLLEWVAGGDDRRRLGGIAWRLAMAHRSECWTDRSGRYLGRDDVLAALTGDDRSCYLSASFENANILGRWEEQLRFANLGLETATGPVRLNLLRGAAMACNMLAPDRVAALIDEATALADPDDVELHLELRRTKTDGLLLIGDLDAATSELRSLWADVLAAPTNGLRIRPLAGIDLIWVLIVLGQDSEVAALADVLCDFPGGEVAGWAGRAVIAARGRRRTESARLLLRAADAAVAQRVPLVDNDVTVVAAIRAVELGEAERACLLLSSVAGGAVRSPGSHRLLRHARNLVGRQLTHDVIARIRSEVKNADASVTVGAELRRLRAEVLEDATQGL